DQVLKDAEAGRQVDESERARLEQASKDAGTRAQDAEARAKDAETRVGDAETRANDVETRMKEVEAHLKDAEARVAAVVRDRSALMNELGAARQAAVDARTSMDAKLFASEAERARFVRASKEAEARAEEAARAGAALKKEVETLRQAKAAAEA